MSYGNFVDHLPSVLLLLALAVVLFAYSKTGQSSSRNNQQAGTPELANRGEFRRVVGQQLGSNRPSVPVQPHDGVRRPEPRSTR